MMAPRVLIFAAQSILTTAWLYGAALLWSLT